MVDFKDFVLSMGRSDFDVMNQYLDEDNDIDRIADKAIDIPLAASESTITIEKGWTPLMLACRINSRELVNWLIQQGSNVDYREPYGFNAWLIAAKYNAIHAVEYLIDYEIDIDQYVAENLQNEKMLFRGYSALMMAVYQGNAYLVDELLRKDADVNYKHAITGETALSCLLSGYLNTPCDLIEMADRLLDQESAMINDEEWLNFIIKAINKIRMNVRQSGAIDESDPYLQLLLHITQHKINNVQQLTAIFSYLYKKDDERCQLFASYLNDRYLQFKSDGILNNIGQPSISF